MSAKYKAKKLYQRYGYLIWYMVFGALTTATNLIAYAICYHGIGIPNVPSNIIAWFACTVVAFSTNKQWVFKSKDWSWYVVKREAAGFFAARAFSGILEVIVMFILVDVMDKPAMPCKVAVTVIVIIINFVGAKLLAFRSRD